MKILHVTKKYPNALGGDAFIVYNIQKQQQKDGHTTIIVTPNCDEIKNDKSIYKYGLKETSATLDAITPTRLFSLLVLMFKVFSILKKERPGVIHTHSIDMAFFVSFAARHYRTPIVHTFHTVTFNDQRQSLFRRKTELFLLRRTRARVIIVGNPVNKEDLFKVGFRDVTFVPNGVDANDWRVEKISKKKNDPTVFISAGRLEEQKGYRYLIEAAAMLKDERENFRIEIVGEGSQKNILKKMIKENGLNKHIFLLGRKNHTELRKLYAHADVMVLPSLWEVMPLSMLEGWAAKLPVIATKVGSIPSITKDYKDALLVAPAEPRSFSLAMKKIMTNPALLSTLSRGGYKKVQQYSWRTIAKNVESIYDEVLSRKPDLIQVFGFYPPHMGGAELRIRDLVTRLADKGYKVDMIASAAGTRPRTIEMTQNLRVNYQKVIEVGPTPFMPMLPLTLWRASSRKPVIFHVHVAHAFIPEITFMIARLRKAAFVAHIRLNVQKSSKFGLFLPLYKKLLLGPVLRRADKVIVLTDDYLETMQVEFKIKKSKLVVIPNATNFPVRKTANRKLHRPVRILMVARLAPQKNIPLMISATKKLIDMGSEIKVDIIGEGIEHKKLEKLISDSGLSERVTLCGKLEGVYLQRAYSACDIVVQTSFEEGFSSVLVEAMASAKPLIATDIEGTRSIVRDGYNGLLVNPHSSESLVNAISKLIKENALRTSLANNGLKEVKRYSWDKIITATENVYHEVYR